MSLSKAQILASLRAAQRNLEGKLSELSGASENVSKLEGQLAAARDEYDRLDNSGRADLTVSKRLRELGDFLDRSEKITVENDGTVSKLTADLRAMIGVAGELYAEVLRPRIDKLEKELIQKLKPYYRDPARAAYVAQQSDCICYLKSHLRMDFSPETDPVALARWMIRRLAFAVGHPDEVPWGRYKPEALGTAEELPQPEAEAA